MHTQQSLHIHAFDVADANIASEAWQHIKLLPARIQITLHQTYNAGHENVKRDGIDAASEGAHAHPQTYDSNVRGE